MADAVTDLTPRTLEAALSCVSTQHQVAANTLATAEPPGNRACTVRYEGALRAALRAERNGGRRGALEAVRPSVSPTGDPAGPDGNNVSLEAEMLALSEASTRYHLLTRMVDRRLQMIGTAIDGRSG